VIGAVLATMVVVMVLVVVMLALMMSGRIVGTVLCHSRSGTAECHGQRYGKSCTNAGNKLHFCLLTHECCTRFASLGPLVWGGTNCPPLGFKFSS
jgi:hypothetical protein